MFTKMMVAWAAVIMVLTVQTQAQYDPLGSDIFTLPDDLRRTRSMNTQKIYIDPNADPMGIDPLMRPLDPEHTWEYLDKISGREYLGPFVPPKEDFRGKWNLDLLGGIPGQVDLMLLQNRDAVFGWGTLSWGDSTLAVSASGQILKDVLYLDLVAIEDLTLLRCTLTTSKDYLSGSFNAFDAYGRVWSGTVRGSRSA